jgi:chromosome segregation ATPase
MFRRLRTRRAVREVERASGLKKESSIFRGKIVSQQPQQLFSSIPNLTATFTDESETEAASPTNYESVFTEPYDVDVTLNNNHQEEDVALEQMKLIVQELEGVHNEQMKVKEAMIHDLSNELDRTRQDFLEVIVELSAKEHELSATKQRCILKDNDLHNVTKDLFAMKEQLHIHASELMQYQHKLHLAEEELNSKRQLFGFLHL